MLDKPSKKSNAKGVLYTLRCVIEWKKGKNVTVKTMKKKQKHKSRGTVRFVTKTMQRDSFFNFFSPPEQQGDTLDEEAQALLAADFEIGHVLKERVVPRAVLYFTGEAIQEDDYDEDEEDEEDEEEDDDEHNEDFDEDDDADPDFVPKSTKKGEPPAECKQQ
ncbi:nucleosome assembly protein 1-like 1 isoform X5 [Ixodes scapularis]